MRRCDFLLFSELDCSEDPFFWSFVSEVMCCSREDLLEDFGLVGGVEGSVDEFFDACIYEDVELRGRIRVADNNLLESSPSELVGVAALVIGVEVQQLGDHTFEFIDEEGLPIFEKSVRPLGLRLCGELVETHFSGKPWSCPVGDPVDICNVPDERAACSDVVE